mgnify:CR=1 FL=1
MAAEAGDVGGTTAIQNRALVAVAGDGDKILESGETSYVLSGVRSSNRVLNTGALNGVEDPVQIKVHGRVNNSTVGALSKYLSQIKLSRTWRESKSAYDRTVEVLGELRDVRPRVAEVTHHRLREDHEIGLRAAGAHGVEDAECLAVLGRVER